MPCRRSDRHPHKLLPQLLLQAGAWEQKVGTRRALFGGASDSNRAPPTAAARRVAPRVAMAWRSLILSKGTGALLKNSSSRKKFVMCSQLMSSIVGPSVVMQVFTDPMTALGLVLGLS